LIYIAFNGADSIAMMQQTERQYETACGKYREVGLASFLQSLGDTDETH
jgi:hypothetical protein